VGAVAGGGEGLLRIHLLFEFFFVRVRQTHNKYKQRRGTISFNEQYI